MIGESVDGDSVFALQDTKCYTGVQAKMSVRCWDLPRMHCTMLWLIKIVFSNTTSCQHIKLTVFRNSCGCIKAVDTKLAIGRYLTVISDLDLHRYS